MTKRQKNLFRILFIVLLLIIAAILVLCSDRIRQGRQVPSDSDQSPEHIVSQIPYGSDSITPPAVSSTPDSGSQIGNPIEASDLLDSTGD